LKRALSRGGPYTTIATGFAGGRFTDAGLINGVTYYYLFSAEETDTNRSDSDPVACDVLSF
jgi:hypothetical protein